MTMKTHRRQKNDKNLLLKMKMTMEAKEPNVKEYNKDSITKKRLKNKFKPSQSIKVKKKAAMAVKKTLMMTKLMLIRMMISRI